MSSRSHGGISLQSKCQRIETRREAAAGAAGAMGVINRIRTDGAVRAICNIARFISWPDRRRRRGIRAEPVATAGRMQEGMRPSLVRNAQLMACRKQIYTRRRSSGDLARWATRRLVRGRTRNLSANKRLILDGEGHDFGEQRRAKAALCLQLQEDRLLRENSIDGVGSCHGRPTHLQNIIFGEAAAVRRRERQR
jgi:hypothetical protein